MSAIDDLVTMLSPALAARGIDASKLDPDDLVAHFTDDEIEAMLAPILADEERAKFNRFADLFPDEGPFRRELYPKHIEFFTAGKDYRERCFLAANRVGKALRNGTPVATPYGWKEIENLRQGDQVIAGDGSVTIVTGVYPQGVKPLYRMTFDVGETIDCCAEHLWKYQHPRARYPYRQSHGKREPNPFFGEWKVANTAAILREVGANPITRMRVVMPTSKPWELPTRPVDVPPYLLGVLLGDGCMRNRVLSVTTADREIINAVEQTLPEGMSIRHLGRYDYRLSGTPNPLISSLKALGIYDTLAHEKFVPDDYRLNDRGTRLAVLQGLMDTDGSVTRTGAMEFSSTSERLASDVQFLVHSLGGKATIERRQTRYSHNGEKRSGRVSYRVRIRLNLCPFRLSRKAERWNTRHNTENRVLHHLEPCEPGEATCISVAHPDHTFVTAHGIVTHNTVAGGYETTAHLTGLYPEWWPGRTFKRPIRAWAAGDTNETTRDIIQLELLGNVVTVNGRKALDGSGLIPRECIGQPKWKQGVMDLVDTVPILHRTGGWSHIGFKSFDQGRRSFQGTAKELIWLDEECPIDVYGECMMRVATTRGILMTTFTPLSGLSEQVLQFLPSEMRPGA